MSYLWTPTQFPFAALFDLKKGKQGVHVAALQLNLKNPNVIVDGDFGAKTDGAVKQWQQAHHLVPDGVAGQRTQESLLISGSNPARDRYSLPAGLLKSIAHNESAFALAAFSAHPTDWGYDVGAYQVSFGPEGLSATQTNYRDAYDVAVQAAQTAATSRVQRDRYIYRPFVASESPYGTAWAPLDHYAPSIYAWQLAVLHHNWPVAADNLAEHGSVYQTPDRDDDPQDWIVSASGGRLTTAREWVTSYVAKSTVFCRWS